jgi:hypothetical protein
MGNALGRGRVPRRASCGPPPPPALTRATSHPQKISSRTSSPTSCAPQRQSIDAEPPDRDGLKAFVRSYLSPQHRDQCAEGSPSAALLDEIARRPAATRHVFTDELMGVIDDIALRLEPTDVAAARTDALPVFD